MYLKNDRFVGYRGNEQVRTRGLFLIFIQPPGVAGCDFPIKCVVRRVALRQCGNWMMGKANIGGKWFSVSGAYGHDGLPLSVPQQVYDSFSVTLPPALRAAWNNGGGWNGAGNEASAIRQWALEHLKELS